MSDARKTTKKGTISLRTELPYEDASDESVKIFAPDWVQQSLAELSKKIFSSTKEITFDVKDEKGKKLGLQRFTDPLSLRDLQLLARNDSVNVTGDIDFKKYPGIAPEDVVAMKDLAKQCVIVGNDKITQYGGYPPGNRSTKLSKPQDVIICDLAGMQFQAEHNTGRLCLVFQDPESQKKGSQDDQIFQRVTGEKQKQYQACSPPRYVDVVFNGEACKLDTVAYQQFVKQDFMLAAKAIAAQAKGEQIDFRFAKYGAGFFASGLQDLPGTQQDFIEKQILAGISAALGELAKNDPGVFQAIKQVTLPFYKGLPDLQHLSPQAQTALQDVKFVNPSTDLLKPVPGSTLKIAVTNCGDPHASLGNEMGHRSVDAAVGENIESKGAKFNPILNTAMQSVTLTLGPSQSVKGERLTKAKLMAHFQSLQQAQKKEAPQEAQQQTQKKEAPQEEAQPVKAKPLTKAKLLALLQSPQQTQKKEAPQEAQPAVAEPRTKEESSKLTPVAALEKLAVIDQKIKQISRLIADIEKSKKANDAPNYIKLRDRFQYYENYHLDMDRIKYDRSDDFAQALNKIESAIDILHVQFESMHKLWAPKAEHEHTREAGMKEPQPTADDKKPILRKNPYAVKMTGGYSAGLQSDKLQTVIDASQHASIMKGNGTPPMVQFRFNALDHAQAFFSAAYKTFSGQVEPYQRGIPTIVRLNQQQYGILSQESSKLPQFDSLPKAPLSQAAPESHRKKPGPGA